LLPNSLLISFLLLNGIDHFFGCLVGHFQTLGALGGKRLRDDVLATVLDIDDFSHVAWSFRLLLFFRLFLFLPLLGWFGLMLPRRFLDVHLFSCFIGLFECSVDDF
jgi:hypothetical protein